MRRRRRRPTVTRTSQGCGCGPKVVRARTGSRWPPGSGWRRGRSGAGGTRGSGTRSRARSPAPAVHSTRTWRRRSGSGAARGPRWRQLHGDTNGAFAPGRGGVQLEPPTERFPFDPSGPPVATFFEAGGNMGRSAVHAWAARTEEAADWIDKEGQSGRQLHADGIPAVPSAAAATQNHPDAEADPD